MRLIALPSKDWPTNRFLRPRGYSQPTTKCWPTCRFRSYFLCCRADQPQGPMQPSLTNHLVMKLFATSSTKLTQLSSQLWKKFTHRSNLHPVWRYYQSTDMLNSLSWALTTSARNTRRLVRGWQAHKVRAVHRHGTRKQKSDACREAVYQRKIP